MISLPASADEYQHGSHKSLLHKGPRRCIGLANMNAFFSEALKDSMDTTKALQSVEMPGNNATVLKGSCFCGAVHIEAKTNMPFPFMVTLRYS